MATKNPSPSQILAALQKFGVDVKTYKNWDTTGRPWQGPDGSPGLTGAVVHHTATASATGSSGAPSLYWAVTAYDKPVCNLLIGRGPGDTYLLSAGSAYHCGLGGPVPELGVPAHGYYGQTRLFGIEIDDAGVKATLTPYQIEQTGKVLAALADLCGWDVGEAVLTHKCYTDRCHTESKSPGASIGRKNDTMDGPWGSFPGSDVPEAYNAPFWRAEAVKHLDPQTWDGSVPSRAAVLRAQEEGLANKAVWRLTCRLYDLGFTKNPPRPKGVQTFPSKAVREFRKSRGWNGGGYSERTEKAIFGKNKP